MSKSSLATKIELPDWPIEWLKIIELKEAEKLSSLSSYTLRRHHADKIIKLSTNRSGMRLGDALMIKR
jgi:hypothetical protein